MIDSDISANFLQPYDIAFFHAPWACRMVIFNVISYMLHHEESYNFPFAVNAATRIPIININTFVLNYRY
jgi:hypothetical protein